MSDPDRIRLLRLKQVQMRAQGAQPPQTPEPPAAVLASPDRFGDAAEAVVNDIGAAFQGVNPIAASEGRGRAVGVLRPEWPGSENMIVDVDGVREPLDKYPADRFITRQEGGTTYVYPRTEDMAASRPESLGRALGYGVVSNMGQVAKQATAPTAPVDIGVQPSFASRGTVPGKVAAAGEQFAPTAGTFQGDRMRVADELGVAAGRIADEAGPGATGVDAGAALRRGGETFVEGVRARKDTLWNAVDTAIGPKTPVTSPETVKFLSDEIGKLAELPNIQNAVGNGKFAGWLDDLSSGNLTWEAARSLRTQVGEAIGKMTGPMADVAGGKLKAIYGALSKDLDAAAAAAGPDAAKAWKRATDYTRVSSERIESAFGKILGKNVTDEQAYSAMLAMTAKDGPRANITSLNKLFQSLPKDDAAVVAGTLIRRMGQATPGAQDVAGEVFSPATFLTNWNKMSPDAREVVARAGLSKDVGPKLTRLAQMVEKEKAAGTFRNTSNTGNVASAVALGGGIVAAPVPTVLGTALSYAGAKFLTSPRGVDALLAFAKGRTDKLRLIAKGDSPLALEAATILRLQAGQSSQPLALPAP